MSHPHLPKTHPSESRYVALNSAEGGKRIAALCFEMPAVAAGETRAKRKTLTLIPAPDANGRVVGADGRSWLMKDPAAVVSAFTRRRAITVNHARFLVAPQGGEAPAYGWINSIRVGAGGAIEFDPEWTPRGETALNGDEYAFLSPEFEHDAAGNILLVVGAGLTNDPNFTQLALNREQETELPMLKEIALALGLTETADSAAIVVAINALKQERQTALNAAQTPDPTKWKPAAELETVLGRATAAETALNALKTKAREDEINQVVDQAVAEGKVVPATRELYTAMCQQEGGLERFKTALASMPVIGQPAVDPQKKAPATKGANGLTAEQTAICAQTGITPEQFLATQAAA